jgi:UPF0755 protein
MSVWFTQSPEQPTTRLQERDLARRRADRRRRWAVTTGISLLALLGVGAATALVVMPFLEGLRAEDVTTVQDFEGPGQGSVEVVVEVGDGGSAIAETLAKAGVVATEEAFIDAYSANPNAQLIRPGTYALAEEMRASEAVAALLDPTRRQVVKFTIPEGFRAEQVFERIAETTGLSVESLRATARDGETLGLPPEADGDVEGWLFPATYEVDPEPTPMQTLAPMVAKTIEVLEGLSVPREQWHDVIVLASMVEKEAKLDEDRPKVARVFTNRLDIDMNLESDATVAYGANNFSTVFTTDEERADDNPYNTYVHPGLPAGAICNPGEAAIAAALSPFTGDWLYFVVIDLDSGETAYAEDAAGHAANVQRMRDWMSENPGDY